MKLEKLRILWNKYGVIKAKNDSLPTQAEARKYAKSISQSNDNSKKTKSLGLKLFKIR
ncbi:hypothetical protein LBBP_04472 (plasmid) [Leptospira borgpetersenii serovar Ballum]|uniref:Uncharacterized protein n=1 Tax=Leptospira borgpetersenii serovar Ballum TaxID=280505 RepID=A0A0S2IYI3_LEPBO|nr:hypothetical protein LBBP_04472 [Leptospira borgpetersenii serovar Ballum]